MRFITVIYYTTLFYTFHDKVLFYHVYVINFVGSSPLHKRHVFLWRDLSHKKMDTILAHLFTLPKGEKEVRIVDFEHVMTDSIRQQRAEGKNWDEIYVVPFYKGIVFDDYLLCLGATDQKIKDKRRNEFIKLQKDKDGYMCCGFTTSESERKSVQIGKLVVESCLHQEIALGHSTQHFDGHNNDSIENLGIADRKTQVKTRKPFNKPGRKMAILKEKDGEVVRYASASDVAGVCQQTIHQYVNERRVVNGWEWRYDTLTLVDDEVFKQYKNDAYVSNMGRVARKVYEDKFVEMELSTKHGYIMICCERLHRVVWRLFGNKPLDRRKVINHISGTTTDNRIVNLEQIPQSENMQQACGKLYKLINKITGEEHVIPTQRQAAKFVNCSQQTINKAANRKHGYKNGVTGYWYIVCLGPINPVQREAIKRRRLQ
jgi:hypothetical protein